MYTMLCKVSFILVFVIQLAVARVVTTNDIDTFDNSTDMYTDNSMENSTKNFTENVTDISQKNLMDNSMANSTENFTDKSSDSPSLYSTKQSTFPSTDESTDNPTGNSGQNFTENSTDKSSENPTADSTKKYIDNPTDESTDNPTGNSTQNFTDNATENPTTSSTETATENFTDESEMECKLTEMPLEPNSMCCGVDVSATNRIVGGSPTRINQYPWLALIEYEHIIAHRPLGAQCGGSLISGQYVLTAAHCVTGEILDVAKPTNVVLGDYDKSHNGPDCVEELNGEKICSTGEVRIAIAKTVPHESFVVKYTYTIFWTRNLDWLQNDIALIKLEKIAPYTDGIRPICLPTSDLYKSHQKNLWLTAAGWGAMDQTYKSGVLTGISSNVKRDLNVLFVSLQQCQIYWKASEDHICAGGKFGESACSGDSGGPLMINNDGQYELVGVISAVKMPCGLFKKPGLYTNVYRYLNWIKKVIKNN